MQILTYITIYIFGFISSILFFIIIYNLNFKNGVLKPKILEHPVFNGDDYHKLYIDIDIKRANSNLSILKDQFFLDDKRVWMHDFSILPITDFNGKELKFIKCEVEYY